MFQKYQKIYAIKIISSKKNEINRRKLRNNIDKYQDVCYDTDINKRFVVPIDHSYRQ